MCDEGSDGVEKSSDPFIRFMENGKIVAEFVEWLFLEKF